MVAERTSAFTPPPRLLLGPGPSMVHPRVLHAMSAPLLGHLDPEFLRLMDEIQHRLRHVFRTTNTFTIALSGTGSAGMEAALVNLVEPGDPVLVGINGVFGSRMAAIVERCGGRLIRVEAPWGRIIEPDAIAEALQRAGSVKVVAVVHAETSTGAQQPLEPIGTLCREHNALFVVDAVTSLGGLPLDVDGWNIDVCYSGTQKCLSCPPGLAPLTLSDRALATIRSRKTPCQSWYLDLSLIADYWAEAKRAYHHTAPISMLYALREALCLVEEEGLDARFARHRLHSDALMAGLAALGCTPFAQEGHRLPSLNAVLLPSSVEEAPVRAELLQRFGIEIGGGLGPLQGKVWRIGLMGESSTRNNVLTLVDALEEIFLGRPGTGRPGPARESALQVYRKNGLHKDVRAEHAIRAPKKGNDRP
ncbi:MAG: alanine--glyoxylate aminotransferase family protein [Nitrospirae bacterium]|nr:MAG: alanine--glyoxylate aminotransferase family protein [Nitrospirota bacterium]